MGGRKGYDVERVLLEEGGERREIREEEAVIRWKGLEVFEEEEGGREGIEDAGEEERESGRGGG